MKVIVTSLLVLLIGCAAIAQDAVIDVRVAPHYAQVGDRVLVSYHVWSVSALKITVEQMPENWSGVKIISTTDKESSNIFGLKHFQRIIELAPFTVQRIEIPQLQINLVDEAGNSKTILSPANELEIISASGSENGPDQYSDLKDIYDPGPDNSWIWILTLGIVSAFIIAAVTYFYLRKRPKSVRNLMALTPAERAIKDLMELKESGLLEKRQFKDFFTRASLILRRYLGLRYRIFALEMTSQELRFALREFWKSSDKNHKSLHGILHISDMVKFARMKPEETWGEKAVESSLEIVDRTRNDGKFDTETREGI